MSVVVKAQSAKQQKQQDTCFVLMFTISFLSVMHLNVLLPQTAAAFPMWLRLMLNQEVHIPF